jgi:hypothetical protein
MDADTVRTVAAILEKIPDLALAKLGPEYSYHSLPFCVIDSVFSIGVRYRSAQNAVAAWCAAQQPEWLKFHEADRPRQTISDLVRVANGYDDEGLADRFFGGKRV